MVDGLKHLFLVVEIDLIINRFFYTEHPYFKTSVLLSWIQERYIMQASQMNSRNAWKGLIR